MVCLEPSRPAHGIGDVFLHVWQRQFVSPVDVDVGVDALAERLSIEVLTLIVLCPESVAHVRVGEGNLRSGFDDIRFRRTVANVVDGQSVGGAFLQRRCGQRHRLPVGGERGALNGHAVIDRVVRHLLGVFFGHRFGENDFHPIIWPGTVRPIHFWGFGVCSNRERHLGNVRVVFAVVYFPGETVRADETGVRCVEEPVVALPLDRSVCWFRHQFKPVVARLPVWVAKGHDRRSRRACRGDDLQILSFRRHVWRQQSDSDHAFGGVVLAVVDDPFESVLAEDSGACRVGEARTVAGKRSLGRRLGDPEREWPRAIDVPVKQWDRHFFTDRRLNSLAVRFGRDRASRLVQHFDATDRRRRLLRSQRDRQAVAGFDASELLDDPLHWTACGGGDVELLEHFLALQTHREDPFSGFQVRRLHEIEPHCVGLFRHVFVG